MFFRPKDKVSPRQHGVARRICVVLGLGVMWGWNALTCCFDYFTHQFHSDEVRYSFPWLFCIPWALCQTLAFCYLGQVSYTYRVVGTFTCNAVCLLSLGLVSQVTQGSVGAVLGGCIVALLGANTSILSASVLGLASILPQNYVKAANVGMGISGFVPPALKLGLMWLYPGQRIESVLIFLGISAFISLLCIAAVLHLEHNEFATFYFSNSSSPASPKAGWKLQEQLLPGQLASQLAAVSSLLASPRDYSIQKVFRRTKRSLEKVTSHRESLYLSMTEDGPVPTEAIAERKEAYTQETRELGVLGVLGKVWLPCGLLFLCVYQTYVQIPGLVFLYHYR